MSYLSGQLRSVSIQIFGRVQGVWFRASTKHKARELGLAGWVCNTTDGSVYLEASGPSDRIQLLIEWCKVGPELARVDRIEVGELDAHDHSYPFEVRKT